MSTFRSHSAVSAAVQNTEQAYEMLSRIQWDLLDPCTSLVRLYRIQFTDIRWPSRAKDSLYHRVRAGLGRPDPGSIPDHADRERVLYMINRLFGIREALGLHIRRVDRDCECLMRLSPAVASWGYVCSVLAGGCCVNDDDTVGVLDWWARYSADSPQEWDHVVGTAKNWLAEMKKMVQKVARVNEMPRIEILDGTAPDGSGAATGVGKRAVGSARRRRGEDSPCGDH